MSGVLKLKSVSAVKARLADNPALKAMRAARMKAEYEVALAHDACVRHRRLGRKFFQRVAGDDKPLKIGIEKDPLDQYGIPDKGGSKHQRYERACICVALRCPRTSCVSHTSPAMVVRASYVNLNDQAAGEVTAEAVQPMEIAQ